MLRAVEPEDCPVLICMSPEGFLAFAKALSEPARPIPEMVEVLKRPAPWEKQGQDLL